MLELCVMPIQPVIKEGKSMKSWLEMMLGKNTGELPPIEAQLQAAQVSSPFSARSASATSS